MVRGHGDNKITESAKIRRHDPYPHAQKKNRVYHENIDCLALRRSRKIIPAHSAERIIVEKARNKRGRDG